MSRVGLFGGSFNPPHAAHQLVALYVLETYGGDGGGLPTAGSAAEWPCGGLDELWFVPTWSHPFGKDLASFEHRVAMCELAAAALGPRVRVSRAEEELAQQPGFTTSHTLGLIQHLSAQDPERELHLIIGADILGETHKWHRWDEVSRLAPPIVIPRGGYEGGVGVAMPSISSTRIREVLHAHDASVAGLLPREVLRYIAEHELYR